MQTCVKGTAGQMERMRIELRGVVYPEDGWWIAHCLELDIAAEGETPTEAVGSLVSLCDYQIRTALENGDLKSIFRSAPPEIWTLYIRADDVRLPAEPSEPIDRFEIRELVVA